MTPRDKKALYVLVPGVLVLVWKLIGLAGGSSTPAPASAESASPQGLAAAMSPPVEAAPTSPADARAPRVEAISPAVLMLQEKRLKLRWTRDPFAPVFGPAASAGVASSGDGNPAPPWRLTGISRQGGRRIAILGGRLVTEGVVLDDRYRVIRVADREVVVRDDAWEYRFALGVEAVESRRLGDR